MKIPLKRLITYFLPLLLIATSTCASTMSFIDSENPPGMKIWRGSYNLHIYCTGVGSPTVILESGLGGNYLDWVLVQPEIARFTRVCSYDRAGYGWSGSGPLPRSVSRIATELDVLLRLAGEASPYILTGHSFGGLISQFFASKYHEKVAGMVLVDSSSIEQFKRLETDKSTTRLTPTKSSFVLYNSTVIPDSIPREFKPLARSLATRRKAVRTLYSELRHFRNSVDILRQLETPHEGIPVTVISRGSSAQTGSSPDRIKKRETVWMQLQEELASRNNTSLLVSEKSGHYIQLSDPGIVINAVKSVLNDIRNKGQ